MFVKFQFTEEKYLLGITYIRPKSHVSYYDLHVMAVEQLMHDNLYVIIFPLMMNSVP